MRFLTCWNSVEEPDPTEKVVICGVGLFNLQTRLMELHRQWELLLEKMREKGIKLLQAQKLVQFLRECEDVMDWINDKVRLRRKVCWGGLEERRGRDPSMSAAERRQSGSTAHRKNCVCRSCRGPYRGPFCDGVLEAIVPKCFLVTLALLWSLNRRQL